MSISTFFGDIITSAPKAAPPITINSDGCNSAKIFPPAMANPPSTEAVTMMAPIMTIIAAPLNLRSFVLLEKRFEGKNRLRVDLANARFGHTEHFGNFAKAKIFKIVKSQNFALHLRQLFEPFRDHAREFPARGGINRIFLAVIGDAFVAA